MSEIIHNQKKYIEEIRARNGSPLQNLLLTDLRGIFFLECFCMDYTGKQENRIFF